MNCPKCNYTDLPAEARFCPKCGQPVETATRVEIRQDVQQNLGRVIGVQTEAIHGDVYGGDIYEVQIYALSDAGRTASWRRFLKEDAPPYKFLAPYTAQDSALFKGRQAEIEQVVRRIGEQRVLVVYGAAGVGKTSLLVAGVIPNLMQSGALVVHIQDYARPVETIRAALAANAEQMPIPLPEDLTLPALVRSVYQATQGSLILVLDQFERVFEPPLSSEQRAAFIRDLAQTLAAVAPEFLRLVIVVREEALGKLAEWSDALPDLLHAPVQLLPLTSQQAQMAIEAPLAEMNYPVSYVGDLVPAQLIPDLDELTPESPDRISPTHLQIVCSWLYQAARDRRPPHIDSKLYVAEAKGADGILARYLEDVLRTQLAGREAVARQVLAALAAPGVGLWATAGDLTPYPSPARGGGKGGVASPEQAADVLDRLVQAELLVSRLTDGRREYAFTSPVVAQEARRLAGPEVERQYQAGDELERVWSAWLARDALATRGQLRYLAEAGGHLSPPPVRSLLLLRSAVASDEPPDLWLSWLRGEAGRSLIRQLEGAFPPPLPGEGQGVRSPLPSTLAKAALLLGLSDAPLPASPSTEARPFGPVAWAAVSHPDAITRQTAALALSVWDRHAALDRLGWALRAGPAGWARLRRQAELRGSLADADAEIEQLNTDLAPVERAGVWLWRAQRRLFRDRHRLAALTLGGAVGAGLGLGLLRALTAALAYKTVGLHLAMNFFWGVLLGVALVFGLALAGSLSVGSKSQRDSGAAPVILSTLLFGLAHLLIFLLDGGSLLRAPLVPLLGFLGGAGLSLALYGQPMTGAPLSLGRWLLRAGGAAFAFLLTQAVFIVTGAAGESLSIVWPGSLYRADLTRYSADWWQSLIASLPGWFHYVAVLDAALVGAVLAIGSTVGLMVAAHWLACWRDLVKRAGE